MKKLLLAFFISIFFSEAHSKSSYTIETLVRSFPIGAFAKYSLGKSYLFWGDKKNKKDITYGFIRPEVEFRTSGLVNYAGARAYVYPLPIVGLFAGSEIGKRGLDTLDTFDCEKVHCKGVMRRNLYGLRAAVAYKKWFFTTEYRKSNLEFSKTSLPYVDEMTTLLGNGDDQSVVELYVSGFNFGDHQIGAIFLKNKMKNNKTSSSMTSILHQYNKLPFSFGENLSSSLISSVGVFKTRNEQEVITFLFQLKINSPREFLLF